MVMNFYHKWVICALSSIGARRSTLSEARGHSAQQSFRHDVSVNVPRVCSSGTSAASLSSFHVP